MSTEKLSKEELEQTNGGSVFGNDSSSSNNGSLSLGIDNLVSGSSSSTDGDESSHNSFSIGNGIGTALGKSSSNKSN